jgi:hypothetical protein
MCPDKLLKTSEGATAEFLRDRVGARYVGVHHANQSHRLAIFRKLVINPRVIAPKGAHANDGD